MGWLTGKIQNQWSYLGGQSGESVVGQTGCDCHIQSGNQPKHTIGNVLFANPMPATADNLILMKTATRPF
jgi:hypothetical protein